MSVVQTLAFIVGWSGWLVALASQLQVRSERESARYWMMKYLRYKRENPPRKKRTKVAHNA